jgi:hypothetical protein
MELPEFKAEVLLLTALSPSSDNGFRLSLSLLSFYLCYIFSNLQNITSLHIEKCLLVSVNDGYVCYREYGPFNFWTEGITILTQNVLWSVSYCSVYLKHSTISCSILHLPSREYPNGISETSHY